MIAMKFSVLLSPLFSILSVLVNVSCPQVSFTNIGKSLELLSSYNFAAVVKRDKKA
jgi:hypothetical protein